MEFGFLRRWLQPNAPLPLAACLCFRDSATYLEEWLDFHAHQGVSHFYLYNNESSDAWAEIAKPWVRRGQATVIDWPGLGVQQAVYDDCIKRCRGRVKWLALIDDDEFLFSTDGTPLPRTLESFEDFAGVGVAWVLFGSSGHEKRESGRVVTRFTKSSGAPDQHVKCIVRPDRVSQCDQIGHSVLPLAPWKVVDENFLELSGPTNSQPSAQKLRINHYLIKSWEEWKVRRARAQANTGKPTPHPESLWREWDLNWSRSDDTTLLRAMNSRK